jgi:sarcosine oxidase / L-pipecolate oxidase
MLCADTPNTMDSPSYLIVGAGCFGASTALALKKAEPDSDVVLIDRTGFPCPLAAAHDLNKIIRAEYDDAVYMRLALEAQDQWRNNELFHPYFHKTGILFAGIEAPGKVVVDVYEKLLGKGNSPAVLLDPMDAKARFNGAFRDGDWAGVTKCTWNPLAGWGDAANALGGVVEAAIGLGVTYVQDTVAKIDFDLEGNCSGVSTQKGSKMFADKVLLCTGAFTPWLLAESAPDRPEIQVGDRMVAAASVMGAFKVPDHQLKKLCSAPIIIHPMGKYPGRCTQRAQALISRASTHHR